MARIDWRNWAPPGRDARGEAVNALGCLAMVTLLAWILFAIRYVSAWERLFLWENGARVLRTGVKMQDLREIIGVIPLVFWIQIGLAAVTAARHYADHYREGSRPVYLMRRLPDRWEYHRRCLAIPAATVAATAVLLAGSLALFYGAYMLFTPAACVVPGQWAEIWRVL